MKEGGFISTMACRKRPILAALLLIFWAGSVEVEGELGGTRVLMIIDDLSNQEDYSTILKYLQGEYCSWFSLC